MPGQKVSERLNQAFALASAVAGVAFLIYFIGGLVTWQRFRTLGLAEEASVAALPREGLLIAGLLALKSPLILGLGALLFYLGLDVVWRFEYNLAGRVAVVSMLIVVVLIVTGLYGGPGALLVAAVGGALAIAAAAAASSRRWGRAIVAYGLFIAVALTGGIVEYVNIKRPPTHLEPAAVLLDGVPEPVRGYFLAESSSFVYLATPRTGHLCQVSHLIRALRRQDIVEIRLAPRIDVWPFGHPPEGKELEKCRAQEAKAKAALANSP